MAIIYQDWETYKAEVSKELPQAWENSMRHDLAREAFIAGRRLKSPTLAQLRRQRDEAVGLLREIQPFIGWTGSYPDLHQKIDALLARIGETK